MALALAATTASAAQVDGIGIKVGVTSSHMHLGDAAYQSSGSATGLVVGPFADVALSRSIAFQPALVFVRRGGTFRDLPSSLTGTLGEIQELVLRRDYLELPLLLRYNSSWSHAFSPSLIAGPAIGWVLAYKVEEDGRDLTQQFTENRLLPRKGGGFDFALVLGVGITRVQGGRKFTLDAVYRMASDGTRSEAVGSAFDADGIDVTLGVRF